MRCVGACATKLRPIPQERHPGTSQTSRDLHQQSPKSCGAVRERIQSPGNLRDSKATTTRQLTEGPFALTACGQARAIPAPSRSFPLLAPSMARSTRSPVRSTNPPPPSAANGTMADKLYEFTCGTLGSFSQRSISSRSSLKLIGLETQALQPAWRNRCCSVTRACAVTAITGM